MAGLPAFRRTSSRFGGLETDYVGQAAVGRLGQSEAVGSETLDDCLGVAHRLCWGVDQMSQ